MDRLWRHFGIRKLAFVLAAAPVCLILRWLFSGSPPDGWYSWPDPARGAVADLCVGGYRLAWMLFAFGLLDPLSHASVPWHRNLRWGLLVLAWALWGIGGVLMVLKGLATAISFGPPVAVAIAWLVFRVALLPIGVGVLVAYVPDLLALFDANDTARRLLVSGRGPAAGFLGPVGTRRHTRPLASEPPKEAGHTSSLLHVGQSLFESTYSAGKDVWLNENSHLISYARTGSGKFLTSIASNLAMYSGSGVFISMKPELADFAVGRRTDQSLFDAYGNNVPRKLGVDTREVTQARFMLPGGRSFVLDPAGQSAWPSAHHNFLSEIDVRDPNAPALINSIAMASFPDDPNRKEQFFLLAPRGMFAAAIGHSLTVTDGSLPRNLAACADFCMGIDPQTRIADPDTFRRNLITLMRNNAMGTFIQRSASAVAQLGPEAFGGIFAELELHTRWLSDQRIRNNIQHGSDFSYQELGGAEPVSVFIVPPRGMDDFQAVLPWLRTHVALSIGILEKKWERPQTPILYLCDEARQYVDKISSIQRGATTLREAGVKLWLFVQSWDSLVETVGTSGALEFFGSNHETAEKISRMLGQYTAKERGGRHQGNGLGQVLDVATPAEIAHELRKGSDLKYVFPASSGPLRLRRVAYRPIVTDEGFRYRGLSLAGHYDEGLSRYRYAHRSVSPTP